MLSVVKPYIRVIHVMRAFPTCMNGNSFLASHFFNHHALLRRTTLHRSHHHFPVFETLFKLTTTKSPLLKKFHHRPMKKKGGTAAGVPRSTGETPSATTSNGAPRDQVCDFIYSILCVFVDGKSPRLVMQIHSLVLNLDRGNQAVSKEAWAFRLLLSAARIFFFSHCHSFPRFGSKAAVWLS